VKADGLFGKRGKNALVALNVDLMGAHQFIVNNMGSQVAVGGITGTLSCFLVEPFCPHDKEYYLSIQSRREGDLVRFSPFGGMEVEDHWDQGKEVLIPAGVDVANADLSGLLPDASFASLLPFFKNCLAIYVDLDCSLLEMNPLTVVGGTGFPLDCRMELDSYALFRNTKKWEGVEFPEPWGRDKCEEERIVAELDEKSGASLKLSVLNENGRLFFMSAGGGASVIMTDTAVDLGYGHEVGNYAEYSGNPKEQETYLFARELLKVACRNPDGRRRALLIGGGVANFTNVASTFTGIIQAIKDYHGKLQQAKMKIFVRRGGPNYQAGLRLMQEMGRELELPVEVYGPETNMTRIVHLAIQWIDAKDM
jgi:ATP citrate (pro-S)-lyase